MTQTTKVTAVVGELGTVMSRGLGQILAEDTRIELLGANIGLQPLETMITRHVPDVAVIGDTATAVPPLLGRLRAAHPALNIIVLAHEPSRSYALSLLARGAAACISRDSSASDILAAIHLTVDGKHLITCSPPKTHSFQTAELAALTRREKDVLAYLQTDAMNIEIAEILNIGVETVRTHASSIYRKLGVRGRRDIGPAS
jgi:DNA-binding NarL/FixJ family response regulator